MLMEIESQKLHEKSFAVDRNVLSFLEPNDRINETAKHGSHEPTFRLFALTEHCGAGHLPLERARNRSPRYGRNDNRNWREDLGQYFDPIPDAP